MFFSRENFFFPKALFYFQRSCQFYRCIFHFNKIFSSSVSRFLQQFLSDFRRSSFSLDYHWKYLLTGYERKYSWKNWLSEIQKGNCLVSVLSNPFDSGIFYGFFYSKQTSVRIFNTYLSFICLFTFIWRVTRTIHTGIQNYWPPHKNSIKKLKKDSKGTASESIQNRLCAAQSTYFAFSCSFLFNLVRKPLSAILQTL